jgi:hypothetical protein
MTLAPGQLVVFTEEPEGGQWSIISLSNQQQEPSILLQSLRDNTVFVHASASALSRIVYVGEDPIAYVLLAMMAGGVARVRNTVTRHEYNIPAAYLANAEPSCCEQQENDDDAGPSKKRKPCC